MYIRDNLCTQTDKSCGFISLQWEFWDVLTTQSELLSQPVNVCISVYITCRITLQMNQTSLRLCCVQMSPQDQVFTETVTLRLFQFEIRRTLFLRWAIELTICVDRFLFVNVYMNVSLCVMCCMPDIPLSQHTFSRVVMHNVFYWHNWINLLYWW